MSCRSPIKKGPRRGEPATGTIAGYHRHRRADEAACDECRAALADHSRQRRATHPGEGRESLRRYQESPQGRAVVLAAGRRYRAANLEKRRESRRQWARDNPEKAHESYRRWRALKASALTIPFTPEQLAARMSFWGNRCWMCRGPFEHVDHVIAVALGGPHCLANLRPACARCNMSKGARDWRTLSVA